MNANCSTPLVVAGFQTTPGAERFFHGYVTNFAFERTDAGIAAYRAQISPWTHFMGLRVNSRIFQELSIREIAETVFKEYGAAADYEMRLSGSYRPQDFVVQYQENDFDFLSRLFHKEGWVFFYEHRADGHCLVITDDSPNRAYCPPLPLYEHIEFNAGRLVTKVNSVGELQAERELQPGKVSLNTFDYRNPRGMLAVGMPSVADQGPSPVLEVYDGTPGFAYDDAGEGQRYARRRMEAFEAHAKRFVGKSD